MKKLELVEDYLEECNIDGLITMLDDKSRTVRTAAIEALGELGDDLATLPLLALFKRSKDHQEKIAILKAICDTGGDFTEASSQVEALTQGKWVRKDIITWAYTALIGLGQAGLVIDATLLNPDRRKTKLAMEVVDEYLSD